MPRRKRPHPKPRPREKRQRRPKPRRKQGRSDPPPPREPPDELEGFEPVTVGPVGWRSHNTYAADAAAFKRKTRERLLQLRANGLTVGKLKELAGGSLKDDEVMSVLECARVPVAVYRKLAKVLDEIGEND